MMHSSFSRVCRHHFSKKMDILDESCDEAKSSQRKENEGTDRYIRWGMASCCVGYFIQLRIVLENHKVDDHHHIQLFTECSTWDVLCGSLTHRIPV